MSSAYHVRWMPSRWHALRLINQKRLQPSRNCRNPTSQDCSAHCGTTYALGPHRDRPFGYMRVELFPGRWRAGFVLDRTRPMLEIFQPFVGSHNTTVRATSAEVGDPDLVPFATPSELSFRSCGVPGDGRAWAGRSWKSRPGCETGRTGRTFSTR